MYGKFRIVYKYKINDEVDLNKFEIISKDVPNEFLPIFNTINKIEYYKLPNDEKLNKKEYGKLNKEKRDKLTEKLLNTIDTNILQSRCFINYYYWITNLNLAKLIEKVAPNINNSNTFIKECIDKDKLIIVHHCNNCQKKIIYQPNSRKDRDQYLLKRDDWLRDHLGSHIKSAICEVCEELINKENQLLEEKNNTVAKKYTIQELKDMPYKEYLQTDHWKSVRKQALFRAKYKCQLCSNKENLNVHHNTYKNRGEEKDEDLIVLCQNCHGKFHDKFNDINEDDIKETNGLVRTKIFLSNANMNDISIDKNINKFIIHNKITNIIDIKTNINNNIYSALLMYM